jgi:hypothetical protein
MRAINYYNSPGWGAPVTADAGYRGKLTNINLGGDFGLLSVSLYWLRFVIRHPWQAA